MKKEKKGGKLIIAVGAIAICTVTAGAFFRKDIIYKYYEYSVNKNYSSTNVKVNDYYLEDNFEYVNNYTGTGIINKKDFIDFVYYAINSGSDYLERYIDRDYTSYSSDINRLTSNDGEEFKDVISVLNNFVHPYNSSNNIKLTYGGDYKIGISLNKAYTDKEIEEINKVVDKVISEKITNSTPTREKIKIIHDFIIDNAEYDKLKYNNKNDATYKSNTAYGVLIQGYGTCNGYADAMAIFLDKLNIINYKISNDEHIWNLVYVDGAWKHLDLTWDDPVVNTGENMLLHTYFLISYDELLKLSFKLILNSDYYEKQGNLWIYQSEDDDFMKEKIANAENINVVGIIKQNEQSTATAMNGGIGYLKDLKEYVINKTNEADIVKEQKENPETNVFTGLEFPKSEEKSEFNFNNLSNEQKMAISQMSTEEIAKVMDTYTKNQNASYENNLKTLGAIDLDKPSSISIYPKTFESKELIAKAIEDYNKKQRDDGKEENTITYTDLVGAMMSSITNIIDAVSYALIAFVSISLVVSSIMIGIITYISVLERTKEIGILRAIGASKKDISRVFNAETFIIGLISGMIGVGITLLLTLPINSIIYALSGVAIHATVSVTQATVLVLISLGLTILAGLIPAKMASKKDPVEALRSE